MENLSSGTLIVFCLLLTACGGGGGGGGGSGGVPPVTATKVEVGKLIFEDPRLSANNNQSCATCHAASAGFADPDVSKANPVSVGSIANSFGDRNAPTSAYSQFSPRFQLIDDPVQGLIYMGGQFVDGRRNSLEEQAKDPFLNPVEMANVDNQAVVDRVRTAAYADKFKAVFGADVFDNTNIAYNRITEAIATFERSPEMNPFNSKFDCYIQDSSSYPLSTQEQAGLDVFDGIGKCTTCHTIVPDGLSGRVLLTNFQYFNIGVPSNPDNPANKVTPDFVDLGLGGRLSGSSENGKFKTPTLRNVELTAPYMHNGVFATLDDVMTFYNLEAKIDAQPPPEVIVNISGDIDGLFLEPADLDAVVAFMKTLTDGSGAGICF